MNRLNGEFFALNRATEANDRIIFQKGSGKLFYDADGNGNAHGNVLFAQVAKGTDLHASDFIVIA